MGADTEDIGAGTEHIGAGTKHKYIYVLKLVEYTNQNSTIHMH